MPDDIGFPGNVLISEFDYILPKENIAFYPLPQRDESRLLVFKEGNISENKYHSIAQYLNAGSLMVFNESKVIQARLTFIEADNSPIEIFCLDPAYSNSEINLAMQSKEFVEWRCMVGDLRKWKNPELRLSIRLKGYAIELKAFLIKREGSTCIVKFGWNNPQISFAEILEYFGKVPLPPYIKREAEEEDKWRYQTVFAKNNGSVAAPTAGLHFTEGIMDSLKLQGIRLEYLTLHVGAGTFKPVKAATLSEHKMHSEQIVIEPRILDQLLTNEGKDIIAVGTTSLRTLESIYWLGVKIKLGILEKNGSVLVNQWDPYQINTDISVTEAIEELIRFLEMKKLDCLVTRTSILILPGYSWKIVDALVTNFHQPKSTLMLLVAAFIGIQWKEVYRFAIDNNFRFLSYGDGSLLFRKKDRF